MLLFTLFVIAPSPLKKTAPKNIKSKTNQQTHVEAVQPLQKEIPIESKVVPQKAPEPTAVTPPPTCAGEVAKYNWDQTIAMKVMGQESSGNYTVRNNNANTGDYSIGCFQVNLLGDSNLRAKYRDSVANGYAGSMSIAELEPWLKNPVNNVAVTHTMWAQSGSFWGHWPNTCRKVGCE